jgi:phage major head subunit gpT-like protein
MDIVQSNLEFLFKQADMRYGQLLAATPTWNGQIATEMPSSSRQVTYGWLARIPIMRKWLGERQIHALATHSRTVTNEKFELTDSLSVDDVEDDQFGLFNMNLSFMAAQAAKWKDQMIAQLLRDATSITGYDGKAIYATDHPVNGGDVSGGPTGTAQSNLNLNKALTYDNYVAARAQMMSFVGEDGQPLGVVPNLLVVPPQREGDAKLILEADFLSGIQANTTAPQANTYKGSAKILVVPELADKPNNWWLLDTTKVVKPYLLQIRNNPQFTYLTNPSDSNVFFQDRFIYGCKARGAAAETVWFLSLAGTSAGSY